MRPSRLLNHHRPSTPTRHTSTIASQTPHPLPPPPTSTVHTGTTYEHLCARTLPRLGFTTLLRTGGRSDRGIDLLSHWTLPHSPFAPSGPKTVPAIVQCKALARKPGPELIRELEGALADPPVGWRGGETVGVLCAKREATAGVRDAVRRCGRGVVWVMVEELGGGGGRVRQVLWNERVRGLVGGGVGAGVRYLPGGGGGGVEREICLMVDGVVWVPGVRGLCAVDNVKVEMGC